MGLSMKAIKKGDTAETDGFLLNEKEYQEYIQLKNLIAEFRSYRKDYNMKYKEYRL